MPKSKARYQIFVSSTYKDLQDERQAAVEGILRAGHIPAGMELFAAQNKPQLQVIKEWIEESDVFCLILGARYGSIEPESGKSYVECEYEHAMALGKAIFSLVLDEKQVDTNVKKRGHKIALEKDNQDLLKAFRDRITSTLVRMVSTPDSIKVAIFESIAALERSHELRGWVRAGDAQMPPQMAEEFARLSAENAHLAKALTTATTAREELIDGRSLNEWVRILGKITVKPWDPELDKVHDNQATTLYELFISHGHFMGEITLTAKSTAQQTWLFAVATALVSFNLMEYKKNPKSGLHKTLAITASGKRLYTALLTRIRTDPIGRSKSSNA